MNFSWRLAVCIIIGLPLLALFLLSPSVYGTECSLIRDYAKCGGMNYNEIPQNLPISITQLDLSNNYLANVNWYPLSRYTKISILLMQNCSITTVRENAFKKLQQLRHVDLSNNRLTYIHNQIFKLNTKLGEVWLNGNDFRLGSESPFLISYSITRLELRDCGIREISSVTFSEMKKLEYLDLSGNKVIALDSQTFHYDVFRVLVMGNVEEISSELDSVCSNGAIVRYVIGDNPNNWCETKKLPGIETKITDDSSLRKSANTLVILVLVLFAVVAIIVIVVQYIGYRNMHSNEGRQNADEEQLRQPEEMPMTDFQLLSAKARRTNTIKNDRLENYNTGLNYSQNKSLIQGGARNVQDV